jgi:hypothetical protein
MLQRELAPMPSEEVPLTAAVGPPPPSGEFAPVTPDVVVPLVLMPVVLAGPVMAEPKGSTPEVGTSGIEVGLPLIVGGVPVVPRLPALAAPVTPEPKVLRAELESGVIGLKPPPLVV